MRARKRDRAINWERERKRKMQKETNRGINDGRGRHRVKQGKRHKSGETIEKRETEEEIIEERNRGRKCKIEK